MRGAGQAGGGAESSALGESLRPPVAALLVFMILTIRHTLAAWRDDERGGAMRRLLRLNAMLIEVGVAVVDVVGGLTAGGLRRLASIGEGSVQAAGTEKRQEAEPEPKA